MKMGNRIKTYFCFLFILLCFTSCSFPNYIFENNSSTLGLNFKEGKWLLGEIDSSKDTRETIKKIILEDFTKKLPQRIFYIYDVKGIIIPKKASLNPSKSELIDLKKGTVFDYFINVKSEIVKNDLNDIDFTNHKFRYNQEKKVHLFFEVYDLKNQNIIYSKKVIGSIKIQDDDKNDIIFSKSVSKLTLGCLKKVLKDINKKSLK